MLLKQINKLWKLGSIVLNLILLIGVAGCSHDAPQTETESIKIENEEFMDIQNNQDKLEDIMEVCYEIYEKAAEEKEWNELESIRSMVECFGEKGYTAVDSKNQVDMVCANRVIDFCEKVDTKEEDKITMIEVTYLDEFVLYVLQTKDGLVNVDKSSYKFENNRINKVFSDSYQAKDFNLTQDGYLMFSGAWFSEELNVLTLSNAEEHTAFRVLPLDEIYRELNRKYLQPVSYERNNIFLTDWSEEDFGTLNFYDVYDVFYPKVKGNVIPYDADDNLGVGAVYKIPKDEFESVIMEYFRIDSMKLQSKTSYNSENSTYEYKPRGFYEAEYPEYPYSEVVGVTQNNNGTITLMVHVVFPYAGLSKMYAHEVVIRPLEDGRVQYVSNKIIPSEDNYEVSWHTPRLTEEGWKEIYGENGDNIR